MKLHLSKRIIPQLLATIAATICNISDGMHYGWTSPIFPILKANDTPIEITETDELWLENIYMVGILTALGITAWVIIAFGIKFSILFGASCHLVSWIMICVLSNKILLYVARYIAGIAGNVGFVSIPMYIGEISDENIRGFFGTFVFVNCLVGLLVIYSIGPYISIRNSAIVGIGIAALQIFTFSFMPGSPYNYLVNGNKEKALKSLKWFRNSEDVLEEFDEITKAVERQESEKKRFADIFVVKSNRKAVIILATLNFAQHFSGISVMVMNCHTILADASSIVPSDKAGIFVSGTLLSSGIASSIFVDKLGRKPLLISSSLLTAISLTVLGVYFLMKQMEYDMTIVNWIPFASVMLYSLAFKFGLGMIPLVLSGELFPTSVKAKGMTLADATYAIFGLASIYLYMYLSNVMGMYFPFLLFAGICYLTTIFVIFYVPETKGKTLEEIQLLLKR